MANSSLWRKGVTYEIFPRRVLLHGAACFLGLRILAGRILRMAALPARWQARHMYQLATVR